VPTISSKSRSKSAAPKSKTRAVSRSRKERSYRQVVKKIDIWSVLKTSLCFYTAAMLTSIVASIVCWYAASAVGIIKNLEKFLGTVFEIKDFSFINFQVLQGILVIGIVFVALMTIISVMAAALYNVFADAVGGIEVEIVEQN